MGDRLSVHTALSIRRAVAFQSRENVMSSESGSLFVVATPIGNLDDISKRAIDVLASVDRILAEDTRHSARLLSRYGISSGVNAFHEHNERKLAPAIIRHIQSGENVALISDAGTPLINDPGFHLLKLAHERGIRVVPIPGPSAVTAALSVCGLATDRFFFEGFLPSRAQQRRARLETLAKSTHTIVLLESPHRVLAVFEDLIGVFGGDRRATIAKELTKLFETVRTDSLETLYAWLAENTERQKGEFVIVVSGARERPAGQVDEEQRALLALLLEETPLKTAVRLAARISGANRNSLYEAALRLRKARDPAAIHGRKRTP